MKLSLNLALAICLSGSVSALKAEDSDFSKARYHLIVVNGNGEPLLPTVHRRLKGNHYDYQVKLERFGGATVKEQSDRYQEYLEAMISEIQRQKARKILIHIHGGMNFVSGAAQHAVELLGAEEEG